MVRKNKKYSGVDPAYLDRHRDSLRRIYRKSVLVNPQALAANAEYCRKFKVSSRSALIREALMAHVFGRT